MHKWWILVFRQSVRWKVGAVVIFFFNFASWLCNLTSFLFVFSQIVTGSGSFEIHLVSLLNIGAEKSDGNCCDGSRTIYKGQQVCSNECDTFFKVCLKHYTQGASSSGPCTFGEDTTAVLGGSSITFTNTSMPNGFRNPISIRFTFSWMVSQFDDFLEVVFKERG